MCCGRVVLRMSHDLSSHFAGGWDQSRPEPQFSEVMLAADCRQNKRSKETKKKANKIISGTVVSGSRDRRHCATIIYMRGKTEADKIHSPERGQCDTALSPGSCSSYPPVPRRLQWSRTCLAESQSGKKKKTLSEFSDSNEKRSNASAFQADVNKVVFSFRLRKRQPLATQGG